MAETKIMSCTCKSTFQDVRYGIGKRVVNMHADRAKGGVCTVCGKAATSGEDFRSAAAAPKKKAAKKGK